MIKVYRKTATIKAEQFDGSADMIGKYKIISTHLACTAGGFEGVYFLPTLEGELRVNIGDWLATGVKNEHWAISDDVFKKTYAELPVITKEIDEHIRWCKGEGGVGNVSDAMDYAHGDVASWIYDERNSDTFARAWLDGYTVDEDK